MFGSARRESPDDGQSAGTPAVYRRSLVEDDRWGRDDVAGSGRAGYANPDLPIISNQVFVVTNTAFAGGAYGDGSSNNAAAINAAITYASGNGGGTVEIPANGTLSTYFPGRSL